MGNSGGIGEELRSSQPNTLNNNQGKMVLSLMKHHLAENSAVPRSSSILIADDNRICREILRMLLSAYGYRCLEANDGRTALGIVRTSSIGFIITDFHMPYVNGCELLEQLSRAGGTPPPAVLVTGNLTDQIRQRALQAGAITVLEKPFDQKVLLGIIHRWLSSPKSSPGGQISSLPPLSETFSKGVSIPQIT